MDNLKKACHFGYSCRFQGFFDAKLCPKQSDMIYLVLTYLIVKMIKVKKTGYVLVITWKYFHK